MNSNQNNTAPTLAQDPSWLAEPTGPISRDFLLALRRLSWNVNSVPMADFQQLQGDLETLQNLYERVAGLEDVAIIPCGKAEEEVEPETRICTDHHRYDERSCPFCGQTSCWACAENNVGGDGSRAMWDADAYFICPHCGKYFHPMPDSAGSGQGDGHAA